MLWPHTIVVWGLIDRGSCGMKKRKADESQSARYLQAVRSARLKKGKNYLLTHLTGGVLTRGQAIFAFCYECMGFYDGGARDCCQEWCPLHPFMPYNPNRQRGKATSTAGNPSNLRGKRKKVEVPADDEDIDDDVELDEDEGDLEDDDD